MLPAYRRLVTILFLALMLLTACNRPGSVQTPTLSGAAAINTAAARTLVARLTQVGGAPVSPNQGTPMSLTPVPPTTGASTQPAAGATVTSAPGDSAVACDRVEFVEDITYPDDSQVAPGQTFVKTWRLKNAGTCPWTTGYEVVFTGQEVMGGPSATPLASAVPPNGTVDISVTLKAPDEPGTHIGDWKLRNEADQVFGIGATNEPFYVKIKVGEAAGATKAPNAPNRGVVYDFLVKSLTAQWFSRGSAGTDTPLTFGGADDDPNGAAKILDQAPLETGLVSGKILLMAPRRETDGVVFGFFENFTVRRGDLFKARLGFITPSGQCGQGQVIFQLVYKEGSSIKQLGEWKKRCDGSLSPAEINLSDLAGKTVQFGLVVRADGPFTDDWAIWSSPHIFRD